VDKAMAIYVVILANRPTGLKTLMSCDGQTRVFDSYQEATFQAHEAYGPDNPSVECRAVRIATRQK
jgi:hypothetical protein